MNIGEVVLRVAAEQVGQQEKPKGSNRGPMVDEYLKAVGLTPGYAWCAAFVYWCYQQATTIMGIQNTAVKTAGVRDCWNRTLPKWKLLKTDAIKSPQRIKPGDQFVLFLGSNAGHTGLVERIELPECSGGKTIIYTIEGNSNEDGSREGYEVVRHKRTLDDKALQGFIQYF